MEIKKDEDKVIFSTGKEKYACCGIIGICPEGSEVTAGYDDGFWHIDWFDGESNLTKDERIELAEHMIGLWEKFLNDAEGE